MSLINDALKKAQKQRTGEAPSLGSMPSVGGESAVQISRRAKPSGFNTLLLRAGLGAGVLLVLVVGGYFALRGKPETGKLKAEDSKANTVQTTPTQTPVPASTQPVVVPADPVATTPIAFSLPIVPKAEPVVAKTEPVPAQPAAPTPQVSEPAKPVLKLEPRAMTFIDNLKVAGIRASATDSKVLMNDRVYRVGDMVEREMGLKLVGITSNSLTFEDERGGRFTRTF